MLLSVNYCYNVDLLVLIRYNTIQYNIRLSKLDRMQAGNTGSGYA